MNLIKILLVITVLVLSFSVLAEDENYWMSQDRIRLIVGGYFAKIETQLRISKGQGTLIDLEKDLGLDDSTVSFRVQGHYRFSPRHRFIYSFSDVSRDATNLVERKIILNGKVFKVGSIVTTDFSVQVSKLLYGYSFFQNNKIDLSFSTGIVGLNLSTKIDSPFINKETDESFLPTPVVGFRGMYAFSRKLVMTAGVDYFRINESNAKAEVRDWNLAIEYDIYKKIAVGLTYGSFNLDGEKKSNKDKFDFDIEGLFIYSKFGFD